ncbi:C2H2 type zinc finger containing protein [Cladophialophora carrionii]|uniref:C2H2 type zinc finger containing protein n=1 Tax=Cladophialophora carrionii TaxID=86049 RepID=A0A1C1CAG2_9EURO|nr:C2H2 type zinc finger containing protein [Cladophialophora carrionii]
MPPMTQDSFNVDINGHELEEDDRNQEPPPKKPKRFQCKHCQRLFARLEHLQRHERTLRHERLSHDTERWSRNGRNGPGNGGGAAISSSARVRQNSSGSMGLDLPDAPDLSATEFSNSQNLVPGYMPANTNQTTGSTPNGHDLSFATLLMAAEHARPQEPPAHVALQQPAHLSTPMFPVQDQFLSSATPQTSMQAPVDQLNGIVGFDFEDSLQDLANFMDNGALSSYHFSSMISAEQPIPFFSPESLTHTADVLPTTEPRPASRAQPNSDHPEDAGSFSRFGSRLPSLQPEESPSAPQNEQSGGSRLLSDITIEDRQNVSLKLAEFAHVVPSTFQLPSRLALSRYLAGYVNGFHEHLPFLHVPTISVNNSCVELIIAMAAVGAQYCFEGQKGVELFHVSQCIAMQRIRQRDARLAASHRSAELSPQYSGHGKGSDMTTGETPRSGSLSGCLGLPSETDSDSGVQREDLMQTAQALLLLMAMATWAKHREILREALAIQSVLATLVRDDGFKSQPFPEDISWADWIRRETTKRTKFIVFCFFNLHTIVYNVPSLILASEVDLTLPCNAFEFKAPTASKWKEVRARSGPEVGFQTALQRLFSRTSNDASTYNSSLGNYVLVHALLQHIFFVRQISRYRLDHDGDLRSDDVAAIEQALRNWQLAWKRNPESSLDPMNPNGPVTFNSTALLRLAYIRLNVDLGPGRALDTRDPVQIANAFRDSPSVKRTPKLVRAVLHSAHALSIPVKIGIHLVAQTQTFMWSIQHSLCTLECAFLLSKWLEALSLPGSGPAITNDERKIATLVKTMLDETEFAMPVDVAMDSPAAMKYLSAGVLRVWAQVFRGSQTWAIVDVIGTSLNIYADMLEAG